MSMALYFDQIYFYCILTNFACFSMHYQSIKKTTKIYKITGTTV